MPFFMASWDEQCIPREGKRGELGEEGGKIEEILITILVTFQKAITAFAISTSFATI